MKKKEKAMPNSANSSEKSVSMTDCRGNVVNVGDSVVYIKKTYCTSCLGVGSVLLSAFDLLFAVLVCLLAIVSIPAFVVLYAAFSVLNSILG